MMNRVFLRFVATACLAASSIASGAEVVRIVATDKELVAPKTIPAGVRHVVFENHGKQIHEAMFVKLIDGMTVDGFRRQVNEGILFPEGALDYSGPGLMSPGENTELWLSLDPGDYVLMCWEHQRSSIRGLTVTDGKRIDDTPPKEDAVLLLSDFKFELQGHLKKGTRIIKVQSLGPSLHEADLFRLHSGHTAADVHHWYEDGLHDPAPADALGGVLDSSDTQHIRWLRRSFTSGQYVFRCGLPMSTNAKSSDHALTHADAGMLMTFQVTE
jgi:hypothetical protein